MNGSRVVAFVFAILFTIGVVGMSIGTIVRWYDYKTGCSDYLKLAGDAPNIEMASQFLDRAVNYVESTGRTSGNSAYIFQTPENDLGIWYNKMKGAQQTTHDLIAQVKRDPNSASQLVRDNALMKIREVVLDNGSQGGTKVTQPSNISVYPNQWLFLIGWAFTLIGAILCWFLVYALSD